MRISAKKTREDKIISEIIFCPVLQRFNKKTDSPPVPPVSNRKKGGKQNRVLGDVKLTAIDKPITKEFTNSLYNKGYSGSTINKILSTLKVELSFSLPKNQRINRQNRKFLQGHFTGHWNRSVIHLNAERTQI